ncbi:MAG: class I SAM-dependent methyltransferase [Isosphaeraceae bacterium]
MAISSSLKTMLPQGLRRRLYSQRTASNYESLYEAHAKHFPPKVSIGAGDFELIGRVELGLLEMEGLKPDSTLVDFGCGTGRLAVHAIPRLREGGRYIGIDISETMLAHARGLVGEKAPLPSCRVDFLHQTTPVFPLPDKSVDMICAFSVFTHIEHEDTFLYLRDGRRIIKDHGRFIFSCLPMDLALSREIFSGQAAIDPVSRWNSVRNVTTTQEFMTTLARMAGWDMLRWYRGDEPNIRLPDSSQMQGLGQSSCVIIPA